MVMIVVAEYALTHIRQTRDDTFLAKGKILKSKKKKIKYSNRVYFWIVFHTDERKSLNHNQLFFASLRVLDKTSAVEIRCLMWIKPVVR